MTIDKALEAVEKAVKRVIKGGPGSGNFGHAGRPGEVGGSASGGGGELREERPDRLATDEGRAAARGRATRAPRELVDQVHDMMNTHDWDTITDNMAEAIRSKVPGVEPNFGTGAGTEEHFIVDPNNEEDPILAMAQWDTRKNPNLDRYPDVVRVRADVKPLVAHLIPEKVPRSQAVAHVRMQMEEEAPKPKGGQRRR
jgi:hypothetical protein